MAALTLPLRPQPKQGTEASPPVTPKEPPPGGSGLFAAARRPHRPGPDAKPTGRRLAGLSLTALGIVYGDIGTSPLYALQQCFDPEYGLDARSQPNVYGVLSLIVWLLILVVSVKYIVFIMRADNRGEGGILALLALSCSRSDGLAIERRRMPAHLARPLRRGAALRRRHDHAGDLGARRGRGHPGRARRTSRVDHRRARARASSSALFVVPALRHRAGRWRVRADHGALVRRPSPCSAPRRSRASRAILFALNPWYGVQFFLAQRARRASSSLGAVVLAVTGAEALYADMGHFGKRPIRLAWFASRACPRCCSTTSARARSFSAIRGRVESVLSARAGALLWPLVVLATIAAVIASQALISGAFSLTQQSVQLGYSPRVTIVHTSHTRRGRSTSPRSTTLLDGRLPAARRRASGTRTSLGAAYGIAVTGTMAITSLLFYVVARSRWNWSLLHIVPLTAAFLVDRRIAPRRERDQDRARRLGAGRDRDRSSSR